MIILNLLPPTQKGEIKKMAMFSLLENLIAGLFIAASVVTIIFLISKNILQNNLAYLIEKTAGLPREAVELNVKIKKLNSKLKTVSSVQNNFTKWSTFLINVNQLIPEKIQITNLEITPQGPADESAKNLLKITGEAAKRENLLTLQKNLESSTLFSQVNSPLSNILQQENIKFTFTIQFDKP